MSERISPDEALDRVFQIIAQEVADNPAVKRRLLEALGAQVVFEGDQALPALDPILLARKGYEEFRSTLLTFRAAQVKKMVKDFNLLEAGEMGKGVVLSDIIDLAWQRALEKLDNVRSRKHAAE